MRYFSDMSYLIFALPLGVAAVFAFMTMRSEMR
jgi:hypothetical protein